MIVLVAGHAHQYLGVSVFNLSHCDAQRCLFFNTVTHQACITQTVTTAAISHRTQRGNMPTIIHWVQMKGRMFLTQRPPLHSGMWLLPKADLSLTVRKATPYALRLLSTFGRLTTLDLWPLPPPPPAALHRTISGTSQLLTLFLEQVLLRVLLFKSVIRQL